MESPAKLYVMEVGRDKDAPGGVFRLSPQLIPTAADTPNDFPVAMQVSKNLGKICHIPIHFELKWQRDVPLDLLTIPGGNDQSAEGDE